MFEPAAMLADDPKICKNHSATFNEFILLPRKTDRAHAIDSVSLDTRVTSDFLLSIPFMSAAMESVTGDQLAIALALHGGLGVVPAGRIGVDRQVRMIEEVKSYRDGFLPRFTSVTPETKIRVVDQMEGEDGYSSFPVLNDDGVLVGRVSTSGYHPDHDLDLCVSERMQPLENLLTIPVDQPRDEIVEMLFTSAYNRAYLVDEAGRLHAIVLRSGLRRERRFKDATRDEKGRLKVGAAISTHAEDQERAKACVAAGADLLAVDASDGVSEYMKETIEYVKRLQVPVVAGNVVDRAGFEYLAEWGADAVKVGIGSGSICTTRRVKAIGRGQATAVRDVALARDDWARKTGKYIPIISDGGLAGTGDMSVALCMGADVLMMGKYFAGFHESPTLPVKKTFPVMASGGSTQVQVTVKPYWGEASAKAKNVRRYQQNDPRTFVIEGEEGFVVNKGSLHDLLPRDLRAIKGTLSSCGCSDLAQFRSEVMLERQSVGSQAEGGTSVLMG